MEVVGVVGDVKQNWSPTPKKKCTFPTCSRSCRFSGLPWRCAPARIPPAMTSALRSAILEVDKNQPLVNVRTMEQSISNSLDEQRFRTLLLGLLAGSGAGALGDRGLWRDVVFRKFANAGNRHPRRAGRAMARCFFPGDHARLRSRWRGDPHRRHSLVAALALDQPIPLRHSRRRSIDVFRSGSNASWWSRFWRVTSPPAAPPR